MKKLLLASALAALAFLPAVSQATPIVINSQLTGDTRFFNPDGIVLNVNVQADTTSNQALWTVDINSPLHPNIKLDEFYFNMELFNGFTFSGFNPAGWAVSFPGTNAHGSGGADFLFRAEDPAGPPNAADVTNLTSLTFLMTKTNGLFEANDFLNALFSCSADIFLGCGQIGAHVQSLNNEWYQSDSGFAMGRYGTGTPTQQGTIPEPASLALVGLGLLGAGAASRKKVVKKDAALAVA